VKKQTIHRETRSDQIPLPTDEQMGGDSKLAGLANMLDRDGDGNPINDVMGMAKGLFGKN